MRKTYLYNLISVLLVVGVLLGSASAAPTDLAWLQSYNVVWTSQSRSSAESMPCGGGDTGLNVWVENGELLCYVQRSGAFDENNQYLKLGRLRVRLEPNPFAAGGEFRQELKLREGFIEITGKHGALQAQLSVWVDGFNPVVHIEVKVNQPVRVVASYENWRQSDVSLPNSPARPRFAALGWDGYPDEVTRFRDEVNFQGDAVLFYHRNRDDHLLIDYAIRQQGLEAVKDQIVNPQKGRTFGGLLHGAGLVADGIAEGKYADADFKAWKLRSRQAASSHHLELVSHVAQTDTLAQWQAGLGKNVQVAKTSVANARQRTRNWWQQFWQRSHIVIAPNQPDENNKAWQIAHNYQLFRYQLGCNAFGEYPTKFNGGNFTFDPSFVEADKTNDPDWRAWGGGSFTAQNQRLVHWPMLKAGDAELVKPQLEMYRRTLPSAMARVKIYYGHEGALFTEHLETFGLPISAGWGWAEAGAKTRQRGQEIPFGDPRADATHGPNSLVERGEQANAFVSYHYESQLEFSYMALEHHRWFGGDIRPYLPLIRQAVKFFDEHYQLREKMRSGEPLDERGKLVIYPSTALESYRGARNPADLIAGLYACLAGLLALDDKLVPPAEKEYYRAFQTRVPDYTFGVVNGERILEPATSYHHYQNVECPQFYPLFPFNQFALGRDDMQLFRNTWKHGKFPKNMVQSWHQDGIFFARMGMTKEAAEYNTRKLENAPRRFPTFWGPGHDWVPDHNWGGSGMIGLQEMLLQTVGERVLLMPAWPKDWDVDFKLHAPKNTVVAGRYRNGKIENLIVTPAMRRKDVVVANSVIVFGDSITQGGALPIEQRSSAWIRLVEAESNGRLQMINEGKGGRPTDSLSEFAAMLQQQATPTALAISLGTNDSRDVSGQCISNAVANLKAMIVAARKAYGDKFPILLISPPNINKNALGPTRPIADQREANLRELGLAYEKLAQEMGCQFVNLFGTIPAESLTKDGVHPDVKGNEAIAQKMLPAMLRLAGLETKAQGK